MSRMTEESESAVRAAAQARVHAEYPEREGHQPEHERQGTVPNIFKESASAHAQEIRPPAKSAKYESASEHAQEIRPPAKSAKYERTALT